MKWFKLTLVGISTALVCFSYYYFFEYHKLHGMYRCLQVAHHWYSCYLNDDVEFRTDLYGLHYDGNTKNFIDMEILRHGAHEKPILYFLRDVMQSIDANQGTFMDIGANSGQYSMFMSRYATRVLAFEPYEPVLERFRRMVELNRLENITIYPVGLGDENSKKPFYKPPEANLGAGSFLADFSSGNSPYGELEIQVGDEALRRAGVSSVALIKMDIEGYEKPALEGLARTLSRFRPVVVFELTIDLKNPVSFKTMNEIHSVFPERYGFLAFDERSDLKSGYYHLSKFGQEHFFDQWRQYDVVAYPAEKSEQIPREGPLIRN